MLTVVFLAPAGASGAPFDKCAEHVAFGVPTLTQPAHATPVCHPGYAALHDDDRLVSW